jgi:hypothetical protein
MRVSTCVCNYACAGHALGTLSPLGLCSKTTHRIHRYLTHRYTPTLSLHTHAHIHPSCRAHYIHSEYIRTYIHTYSIQYIQYIQYQYKYGTYSFVPKSIHPLKILIHVRKYIHTWSQQSINTHVHPYMHTNARAYMRT